MNCLKYVPCYATQFENKSILSHIGIGKITYSNRKYNKKEDEILFPFVKKYIVQKD